MKVQKKTNDFDDFENANGESMKPYFDKIIKYLNK